MTESVAEAYYGIVDIMMTITVLGVIAYTLYLGNTALWAYQDRQASIQVIEEYRKYNQFDNNVVYQQDIIGVILETRGEQSVSVKSSYGTFVWSYSNIPSAYTAEAINRLIDPNVYYRANIRKDDNGAVVGYEFVAI